MRSAVVVFPGSNCDHDCLRGLRELGNQPVDALWHKDAVDLDGYDLIVLPGGFSYGDYLRSGAIARYAPIMSSLKRAVDRGQTVLGICNGFQILLEAQFLPGAMQVNQSLKFICKPTMLRVERDDTRFTSGYGKGEEISIPVAHREGNYFCDDETLARLQGEGQILFRYVDNPNGAIDSIAGIMNNAGNVLGMMPHPERALRERIGSTDGIPLFRSILESLGSREGRS